jgi:ABC-2 type transport system permease protein
MSNTLVVARKELLDLLNSRLIVLILAWYVIIFLLLFYKWTGPEYSTGMVNPVQSLFVEYIYTLCYYGTLVAVVLGFSSMSSEISRSALNTLLVKPLYRDTIIRGKMIAAVGFMVGMFLVVTCLYVIGILLFFGDPLLKINLFLSGLPLALVLYLLCMVFYYSVSMFAVTMIRGQSLALFAGLLSWIMLFYFIPNDIFVGSIAGFFGGGQSVPQLVGGLSHYTMLYFILGHMDIQSAVAENGFEFMKLSLYCLIGIVLTHITFLRRDVS